MARRAFSAMVSTARVAWIAAAVCGASGACGACGHDADNASNGGAGSTSDGGAAGASDGASSGNGTGGTGGASDAGADADAGPATTHVLVYSRTTGFRHASIPDCIAAIQSIGASRGWVVTATEDPVAFVAALPATTVVVFALTTGDVLDDTQQASFESYVRAGGGFVGLHSATDTEYDWPFYQALVGATFLGHPAGTPTATLHVVDRSHPAVAALPDPWTRADEWYSFRSNPASNPAIHVLVTIDESTYSPDATLAMGSPHPLVWWQSYMGARSFYSELGHTSESYADPVYRTLLAQAIAWASSVNGRAAP